MVGEPDCEVMVPGFDSPLLYVVLNEAFTLDLILFNDI